jgi:hypothetical protein
MGFQGPVMSQQLFNPSQLQQPQGQPQQSQMSDEDLDRALRMQLLTQSQQAQQDFSSTRAAQDTDMGKIGELEKQQQGADLSYHPKWSHGEGVKGVFKNIGKGLLTAAVSTAPGAMVENTVYAKPRQEYASRASQIRNIQERMGIRAKELEPEAQLAYRAPYGYAQVSRAGTEAKRAASDAERKQAQTRIETAKNEIAKAGQKLQADVAAGKLKAEEARTQMMQTVANITAGSRQDVASILSQTQEDKQWMQSSDKDLQNESEHWMQQMLGIGPAKPVTPAAGRPRPAARQAAPTATHIWTPQGLQPAGQPK